MREDHGEEQPVVQVRTPREIQHPPASCTPASQRRKGALAREGARKVCLAQRSRCGGQSERERGIGKVGEVGHVKNLQRRARRGQSSERYI